MHTTAIRAGDRVRSFDFDHRDLNGPKAFYVEGTVTNVLPRGVKHKPTGYINQGCDTFVIMVDLDISAGMEREDRVGSVVFAPVNGVPKMGTGRLTNGVVQL